MKHYCMLAHLFSIEKDHHEYTAEKGRELSHGLNVIFFIATFRLQINLHGNHADQNLLQFCALSRSVLSSLRIRA